MNDFRNVDQSEIVINETKAVLEKIDQIDGINEIPKHNFMEGKNNERRNCNC